MNSAMDQSFRQHVLDAFDPERLQPPLSDELELRLLNSESGELWKGLRGKRWVDVATTDVFQALSSDVLAWTAYLPLSWYMYYLPAFLIVADEGISTYFENFRGILCEHLELTPDSCRSERDTLLFQALHKELNDSQRQVVKQFLDKYPG